MIRTILLVSCLAVALSAFGANQQSLLNRADQLSNPPPDLISGIKSASAESQAHYSVWLEWLEREPQRLGQVRYRNEPLVAGSRQNIEVSFQLGTDIEAGGRLFAATHWMDGNLLQNLDARAENYVDARVARQGTGLSPIQAPASGVFAGRLGSRVLPMFEVSGAGLLAGDTVTFQVRNLVLPGRAGDFFLPVYFSTGFNQPFFTAPLTSLTVRADGLSQIEVTAPSRLGRGEIANITVTLADKFGNPVGQQLPTLDVIVDGVFSQRLTPDGSVNQIRDVRFSEPGLHQVEVRTGGGSTRGISNPIMVQSGTRQVVWADLNQQLTLPFANASSSTSLGHQVRAVHDTDLGASQRRRLSASRAQIQDSGLRGGGSRWVLGPIAPTNNWRSLPDSMQMALPLVPTDDRAIDPAKLQLVQMVSGDSVYEWFANRLFQAGYRLGMTGSAHSLIAPIGPYPRSALTAVIVDSNQSIDSALQQRATYATTGARIVVQATVNGAQSGRRISKSQNRMIEGWVQGTAGIERIELIKNGAVVETLNVAGDTTSQTLKVTMRSDSSPYLNQRDLPRNGREWIGFLKTNSADISSFSAVGFRNPSRQAIAENGASRVDFITWTHGGDSSFLVTLTETNEEEVIELNLRDGHEDFDLSPELRRAAATPASRQLVPLFDLQAGPVTRFVKVEGYNDEIRFEFIDPEAPSYVEFRFSDVETNETEDYYYIRVSQLDDHKAWTSPVFVGGFDAP